MLLKNNPLSPNNGALIFSTNNNNSRPKGRWWVILVEFTYFLFVYICICKTINKIAISLSNISIKYFETIAADFNDLSEVGDTAWVDSFDFIMLLGMLLSRPILN